MSSAQPGTREVALGLAEALRPALAPDAPLIAIIAACDVARLMGLTGLGAALAELERHARATQPRPEDVDHVAGRISRTVERAEREGDLLAFHAADRELGTLAAQLAATEWSAPGTSAARGLATLSADEAFAGLALSGSPEARRSRMTMTVASAVRAAVDWLGADESPRVTLEVHDTALTLSVTATHEGGIGPAGAVLAAVEGSLGREADGRWTIRVATATERSSYLLMRQGRYGIALPWHSVARLRMFSLHELDHREEPRLAPLSTGPAAAGEMPAALIALGLARAWFVADRIVWRMAARAAESEVAGPFSGVTRVIEVESGERYWVLEPAWLLRAIAPPDTPPPSPRPRTNIPALEALPGTAAPQPVAASPRPHADASAPQAKPKAPPAAPVLLAPVATAPVPAATPAPLPGGEALAETVERVLARLRLERTAAAPAMPAVAPPAVANAAVVERVVAPALPVAAPAAAGAPSAAVVERVVVPALPAAAPAAAGPPSAPESAAAESAAAESAAAPARSRRALVADDSLVARIFLTRLLEQRGWMVEAVADAASLWEALHRGPWGLVCADIAMPDAQGAGHVTRLVEYLGTHSATSTCIVLTRDAADDRIAREAGASHVLRKPFEADRLDPLLPG